MITAMAAELVRCQATATEQDAIRSLIGRFRYDDVVLLVGDALAEARRRGAPRGETARR